jgi:predicted MPP superfamily phosphohydrolase
MTDDRCVLRRPARLALSTTGALAGVGAAIFAGALIEAHAYHVVAHQVPVAGLRDAAGLAGRVRVLHLSDVHYVPGQLDKLTFIAGLARLRPDVVVCTGDLLSDDAGIDELTGALADLLALPGVFVFGSNDMYGARAARPLHYLMRRAPAGDDRDKPRRPLDWRRQRDVLCQAGWVDLNNHRASFQVGGTRVELRGTGDAHIDQDDYPAVAGPASVGVDLSLGVTHSPYRRVLDAMCADGLPLIFAGHTHGGQVCLPGGRALTSNCDLDPRLASGLHWYTPADPRPWTGGRLSEDGAWLHVSRGVGTSPTAPYRLFCRPEACLIELVGVG